jgi:VCBS repeat-containing protein
MKCWVRAFVGVISLLPFIGSSQPVVAIHDSEFTRALETMPASGATPTGPGTTSNQWWTTQWHYHVMPNSLKEAFRSDGTPFTVVSDANIRSGSLLTNGLPKYPIVISLASEAVTDDEVAQLTNYVAAGGFLVVGSSAFTRNTNGTTRGDFALANEMGVHMAGNNLQNWTNSFTFTKVINHRLVSHIPGGVLTWQMPSSADEVPLPYQGVAGAQRVWRVNASDAMVLAQGDTHAYLLVKQYGKGFFIYNAAMQPLIGHGGYAPGMYTYLTFRRAIEWSFRSAHQPIAKLSPWPYSYDAAFMVRHDFEDFHSAITNIAGSALYEFNRGAKGDYYFCTGTLREELTNSPSAIANMRQAVSNYNATIGPHNGGLQNPQNAALPLTAYDYWHWGPDQAYNVSSNNLPLPGFTNGYAYAFTSLSNSFADVEGWLAGYSNGIVRGWTSPYFNATRENSFKIQEQLGVKITGELKVGPFPNWTISTDTADKSYGILQLPTSEWYANPQVAQSLESGHTKATMHDGIDFYYDLGALINFYSHTPSTGTTAGGEGAAGELAPEYINYSLNTNLHPRIWSANANGIYAWWLQRSNAQISTSFTNNGNQSIATISVSGSTDPQTAVEFLVPSDSVSGLQVLTNGIAAGATSFRSNGPVVKVLVGTTVTNAQIRYVLNPDASNDVYTVQIGQTLSVPATGVLANDITGVGTNLTAALVTAPAHGTLTLTNNGGFRYTPTNNFTGVDNFLYYANDGVTNSSPAIATIDVPPAGALFFDDFSRSATADPLAPWTIGIGKWTITNNVLLGTASGEDDYSDLYVGGTNWTDYSIQATITMPTGVSAWDAGLGGRVNPISGDHYLINIYPEGSGFGGSVPNPAMRIIKARGWRNWGSNPVMAEVGLSAVGGSPHTLKATFRGNQITVSLDGTVLTNVVDNNFEGIPAYTNGGASAHVFMSAPFTAQFDDFLVNTLPAVPIAVNDSYTTIQGRTLSVPTLGVLTNDAPGLGTNLTAVLLFGATNGILNLTNNGGFSYTPTNNFFGTDGFTYRVNDGVTNSDPASVVITVLSNRPPIASNDTFTVVQGHLLTVFAAGVLSNDAVGWGTNLTAALVTGPTNGTLNFTNNGGFTYISSNNFTGIDTFTYRADDGVTNSSPATVAITVTANSVPLATNDTYIVVTNGNLHVSAPGVLSNDADANGDPLTAVLVSTTTHGTLILTNNGGFSYSPTNSYVGPDTFTYRASDGLTNSAVATVTITVTTNGAPNQAPVANNDSYNVTAGSTFTVGPAGILANDTDGNGDPLTAVLVAGPTNGILNLTNNGGFGYTPTNNFIGTDVFTYRANDGQTNSANIATVSLVVASNTPAGLLFFDDFTRASTNANPLAPWQVSYGKWAVTNGVLSGTASNESDFGYAYLPTNWVDYAVQADILPNPDMFAQGFGGRLNATTGNGYAAVIFPGISTLRLFKLDAWTGSTGYSSPMAELSIPDVGTSTHTVKLAFKGNRIAVYYDGTQLTSVLDNNFNGTPYYSSGGILAQMFMTAAFMANYDNVMVAPLAMDDAYSMNQSTTLSIGSPGILANDTPVFGTNLTAVLVTGPTNGTLTLSTNGSFAYTPTNLFSGIDRFIYQANNGPTNLGTATVSIQVASLPTIIVSADNKTRAYGQTNGTLTGSLVGVQGGDNITATYTTTATTNSPVGTYVITPVLSDPDGKLVNYVVTTNNGTLTVTQKVLVVSADNKNRLYGATNPPLTSTFSGFVNGENTSVLSGAPTLNTTATTNSPAGQYAITITNGTLGAVNYSFSFSNGVLTVGKALLTVTANNQFRLYGTTNPTFTVTFNGFVNGENTNVLSGSPALSTAATTNSPAGQYTIAVTNGTLASANYNFSFTNGLLTVSQAALLASADNKSRSYGATNPVLTVSYTGFVNGENSSALSGAPNLSTSATTNSNVGQYPINLSQGTLASPNYAMTFTNGTLTVTQAVLTVTGTNMHRPYGASNPTLTVSYSGFVNAQNLATSGVTGSPDLSTSANSMSPVGPYPIVVALGTLSASNYSFNLVNGVLTVGQTTLIVLANNSSRAYGGTNQLSASYSGFVNGENSSVLSGAPALSTPATTNSPVGQYTITVTNGTLGATNYAFGGFSNAVLTVTQALLTVSANNQFRLYGATNPALTASFNGFVNGENQSVLSGAPALSTSATTNSPVGPYAITITNGTLSATNYAFAFSNGVLTVGQASLTVTANSQFRLYGATNPIFTASITGFVNGENSSVLSGSPSLTTTATTNSPVGPYTIVATNGTLGAANYIFSFANGVLTVGHANLLVSADPKSRSYGATNPVLTASFTGFVNGENPSVLSGVPALNTAATTNSPVGQYAITVTNGTLSSPNYTFSGFSNSVLTVTQALLTVSANNQFRLYGATNPTLTATITGFVNGETTNVLSGAPALSTTATTNSPAGPYAITVTNGTLSATNYAFSFNNGLLTVGQASLTVTANSQFRLYGATNPVFTASIIGFVNGENSSVLSGTPSLTTSATTNSPVGPYPIVATNGTLSSVNYNFSFVNGVLTVGQALLSVTANNQFRLYGTTNPTLTATITGFANGENSSVLSGVPSLTTTATTNSPIGPYPIVATNGTLSATNYAFSFTNGVLTVGQASLTVTANNQFRLYGETNPIFTATITGFVNGENSSVLSGAPSLTTTAATNSPAGPYTIVATNGTLSATNYAFNFNNGLLTVAQALLSVTANNQFRLYGATNPTLTATITGFVNGENPSVLSGSPSLTTTATTNSPVGPYTIDATNGTLSSANYAFSFTNGVLTINPATLNVKADNQIRFYGAANPLFTATYTGFVNGETLGTSGITGSPSLTTTATSASPAGNYPITAAHGTLSSGNYVFTFTDGTLTVVLVQPTILSITGAGTTNVIVAWSAVKDLTYRVQYQTNLIDGPWFNLAPDVMATNSVAEALDNPDGAPMRFYRIQIVP